MEPLLRCVQVEVLRSNKRILGPISWQINAQERWVILGPNGAGKTTLLQLLAALIHPSKGSVEILGEKMGSTDVFNTSGMRSVIWKKKREKMAAKHAMDAASAVGVKLKGKVTVQDGIAVVPSQGYVARLKNLRQDHSGLNNDNSGMSR